MIAQLHEDKRPLSVYLYFRLAFFLRFWAFSVFFSSVCRAVVTARLLLLSISSRWCSISASTAVRRPQITPFTTLALIEPYSHDDDAVGKN